MNGRRRNRAALDRKPNPVLPRRPPSVWVMARISINDWIIESFVAIFQWCGAQCAANRFRNAVRRKESMMKPGRNEIKFGLWMRAGIVGAMLFLKVAA